MLRREEIFCKSKMLITHILVTEMTLLPPWSNTLLLRSRSNMAEC